MGHERDDRWREPTARFTGLLSLPEPDIPLDEAAFVIAAHAHETVDPDAWLERLDELAARCAGARGAGELGEQLFVELGFAGNTTDYTDPRNSLLDDVIDRRLGIPISLSILMVEVGRRLGVPLHGVGMPGHFLVGSSAEPGTFVDPFHAGRTLDAAGCAEIFHALSGPDAPFADAYLAPTGTRAVLLRVLNNLQRSYLERGAPDAVWVARLRLRFDELPARDRRQTATLLGSLGRFAEAAAELDEVASQFDGPAATAVASEAQALRAREN